MKTILVVGGAGYIGSHLCKELSKTHSIIVLDNLISGFKENIQSLKNITFINGDLGDETVLNSIFEKHAIESVFHFAAFINVGESVTNPKKYYNNNVVKTISLLHVMLKHHCYNFIFSSTAAVYGEPNYLPLDENHSTAPINPYGYSKLMVEQILKDYSKAYGLNYAILRYFNVCGASIDGTLGDRKYPAQHLIPILLYAMIENKSFSIYGDDFNTPDGTGIRDFIHIEDLIQAHIKSFFYLIEEKKSLLVNLGTSTGTSVKTIIDLSKKITNKNVNIEIIQRRQGDPAKLFTNYNTANSLLGWTPQYTIDDIITSTWRWICSIKK